MQILLPLTFILCLYIFGFPPTTSGDVASNPVAVADLILYNGQIVTMDPALPQVQAMAVKDGRILLVGGTEEVLALQGNASETRLMNLNGLTVLPGFNDAHCHWFSWREHLCTAYEEDLVEYPSLEDIMDNLSANGWTSISELAFGWPGDGSIEHMKNAMSLEAAGNLSVRVNGFWGHITDVSMFDSFDEYPPDRQYSERIRAQGIKLYVDHPLGISDILTQEETDALVQRAHGDGWQIAAHAVNVSGVEKILTAYEKVLGNESNENYRYRIEHAVKVTDDQMNRMLKKGIIASFQLMGPPDWPAQESHMNYISNTHPELQMRWREFVDAGLPSVASTDAPFNNTTCAYNPFLVIYQGVTRLGYLDRVHEPWELNQRLTIAQCLKLMTVDGAYATKEENIKGTLMQGKYADFTVVSENPLDFENDPERLLGIEVLQTVVGGQVEYCANNPCYALCSDSGFFDLDSIRLSASKYLPDQQPPAAFDGDLTKGWGAGAHPPQWMQIDLLRDRPVSKINLTISQYPNGQTVHQIWGSKAEDNCDLHLVHEFKGNTVDGQVLLYQPDMPDTMRFIRILTSESPSWVAWFEINLQYADDMSTASISIDFSRSVFEISPNPASSEVIIEIISEYGSIQSIEMVNTEGRLIKHLDRDELFSGPHRYPFSLEGVAPGLYFIQVLVQGKVYRKKLIITN